MTPPLLTANFRGDLVICRFRRTPSARPDPAAAFTLLELLTVIAVVSLLAALCFPLLTRVRAKAREAECINNMRKVGLAFQSYAADHKGRLPVQKSDGVWYKDAGSWSGQLLAYVEDYNVTACPEAAVSTVQVAGAPWPPKATFNYNPYVSTAAAGTITRDCTRLSDSREPARDILMLDGRANNRGVAGAPQLGTPSPSPATATEFYPHLAARRGVVFADGHVEMRTNDLSYRYWQWPLL